ncbi:MAG: hypothetical protein QF783_05120, partial [Arenicellales bacterium]|nr:hypothetical protein [Arenicellales bacterium]
MSREQVPAVSSEVTFSLDAAYYTSEAIYQKERSELFTRTWQYAGHLSQVAKPGDYFSFDIADQSLFCIRDSNNVLHTFYNV